MESFFVYILRSLKDDSLYIGQTKSLTERLKNHNKGLVKSTRLKIPYKLCYFEEFKTRSESMFREWELKNKWNTERKKKLISSFDKEKLKQSNIKHING